MPGLDRMREINLNLFVLRMLEDTFSLGTAQMKVDAYSPTCRYLKCFYGGEPRLRFQESRAKIMNNKSTENLK